MTIFETVKTTITPRQAAEHFGLAVGRTGMTCCPFHDDRHPSMKLNEEAFYCFGCGEKGDVIDFTAKLYGITNLEAAQKLAADFGITAGKPSVLAKLKDYKTQAEEERKSFLVLNDYLHLLLAWKKDFAPATPDEKHDPRFTEACHMLETIDYMVGLLAKGSRQDKAEVVADMKEDNRLALLAERIKKIKEGENEPK